MNKSIFFSFIASIIIAFTSCKNKDVEAMTIQIDSVYKKVQENETILLSIDTAAMGKMIKYNVEALKYIQDNFKDTASKEEAIFMSDIVAVKRSFSKLIIQREDLIKDMIYAKAQLNDLKKDVENGLIGKEEFDTYFQTECKAINLFINSVEGASKWNESNTKRFETMKPQIEEFKQKVNNSAS